MGHSCSQQGADAYRTLGSQCLAESLVQNSSVFTNNNRRYLFSACTCQARLGFLQTLLILTIILREEYYSYLQFTKEGTGTERLGNLLKATELGFDQASHSLSQIFQRHELYCIGLQQIFFSKYLRNGVLQEKRSFSQPSIGIKYRLKHLPLAY